MSIEILCEKISRHSKLKLNLSNNEYQMMKYSLEIILGEASKFLILFVFFLIFKAHLTFVMSFFTLTMIRSNIGGLHFQTYSNCLGFSLIFFATCICLNNQITLNQIFMFRIGLSCLMITLIISPIFSNSRPNYNNPKKSQFKYLGCAFILGHILGFIIIKNNPYFTISMWVIFLQTIQLLVAKGVKFHEEKKIC